MSKCAAAVLVALLSVSAPALAGALFDGQTVRLTYEFPALGSIFDTRTFVVGAGVEAPAFPTGDPRTNIDFSDLNILVTYRSASAWTGASFNGFHVFDLNGAIPGIASVSLNPATNMAGLDMSRITWDVDNIWVNWQGLPFNTSTIVSLDVSPIPEPSTLALLGLGLTALLILRRRP